MTPEELKELANEYFADNAHKGQDVFYATGDGNFFTKENHHAALHHATKTKSKVYEFARDAEEVKEANPEAEKERIAAEAQKQRDKDVTDANAVQEAYINTLGDLSKETIAAFKKTTDALKPSAEVKAFAAENRRQLQAALQEKKDSKSKPTGK